MEEFDLIRVINKLLPFLIFIGWIFISMLGKGKKKQLPPPVSKSPSSKQPLQKTAHQTNKPTTFGVMGELKKSLQAVFKELGVPLERVYEPADEFDSPDIESGFSEKVPEVKNEPVSVVSESELKKSYNAYSISEEDNFKRISRKTLRQGIIWSEILSPPLSLREDRQL